MERYKCKYHKRDVDCFARTYTFQIKKEFTEDSIDPLAELGLIFQLYKGEYEIQRVLSLH